MLKEYIFLKFYYVDYKSKLFLFVYKTRFCFQRTFVSENLLSDQAIWTLKDGTLKLKIPLSIKRHLTNLLD